MTTRTTSTSLPHLSTSTKWHGDISETQADNDHCILAEHPLQPSSTSPLIESIRICNAAVHCRLKLHRCELLLVFFFFRRVGNVKEALRRSKEKRQTSRLQFPFFPSLFLCFFFLSFLFLLATRDFLREICSLDCVANQISFTGLNALHVVKAPRAVLTLEIKKNKNYLKIFMRQCTIHRYDKGKVAEKKEKKLPCHVNSNSNMTLNH